MCHLSYNLFIDSNVSKLANNWKQSSKSLGQVYPTSEDNEMCISSVLEVISVYTILFYSILLIPSPVSYDLYEKIIVLEYQGKWRTEGLGYYEY